MFTIAGILADEEPKTPISPNGLYDTSVLSSISGETFSQDLLSGRSEFTIMYWAYIDSASGTYFVSPYRESTPYGFSQIAVITAGANQINVSLKNSNGGTTTLITSTVIDYQGWFHVCVTGSVSNNRVRAYYNGVLEGSAVMTYSNATATGNEIPPNSLSVSYSQLNVYDRELTEVEVAEHYVNINGQVGVLSYDAMTTGQRSGLIYCSSWTNDISYDGNEFKDKSTNNISLSTTPPLTGQQIYVYTDVSTTQIYAVNSADFNGLTSYAEAPAPVASALQIGTQSFSENIWAKIDGVTSTMMIRNSDSGSASWYDFYVENLAGTPTLHFRVSGSNRLQIDATNIVDNNWHMITVVKDNNPALTQDGMQGELRVYFDAVVQVPTFVDRADNASSINVMSTTEPITFGRRSYTNSLYLDGSLTFDSIHVGTVLTPAQLLAEYGDGTPKCFEESPNEATITEGWDLGTYTGSRGAYTGYKGIQDLTTVTNVTLTGTGLNVECTPPPSNALPSILPTIL